MGQVAAKSDAEKRGHDRPAGSSDGDRLPGRAARWAEPAEHWPESIQRWYSGLVGSGQAVYYQQSDADQAWLLADILDRGLAWNETALVRAWLTGSRELLTTESARRGAHIRLEPSGSSATEQDQKMDDMMNVIKGQFGEQAG